MDIMELGDVVELRGTLLVNDDILGELEDYSNVFKNNFKRDSEVLVSLYKDLIDINYKLEDLNKTSLQDKFKELEDTLYYIYQNIKETKEVINEFDSSFAILWEGYSMELQDLIDQAGLVMTK